MGFTEFIRSLFRHDLMHNGQARRKTRKEREEEAEEEQEELVALDII
jgi:hypothetical protein